MNKHSRNILKVCRICLQHNKDSFNIFDDNKESKDILDKIYLCFQIILNSEKYLPHTICKNCVMELNTANNFRLKCITFDERFSTFYQTIEKDSYAKTEDICCQLKYDNDDLYDDNPSVLHEDIKILDTEENFVPENKSKDLGFKCDMCAKILKSKLSLSKHIISMHQKRKHVGKVTGFGPSRRYHCTSCSYSTPHSQTLVNHMRRHDGGRPYHCSCGKSFTQSSSLAAHQKTHSNTTYYTCTVCGKQFKHAYSLKKHQQVHENGQLICSICHKVLKSKQSLQDHTYRHYNIRNFNCEDCGDTFVTSSELISHRKKHNLDKRVECYLCGYKTHTKKSLIIHLKRYVKVILPLVSLS